MTLSFRPTKNKGSIIGGKKVRGPRLFTKLRLVSPKQASRTAELKRKLKQMLVVQDLHVGMHVCQKCGKIRTENNGVKLVADHVNTRNEKDADRFENLGVLCWSCNYKKGSIREEYRPAWFIDEMRKLDARSKPSEADS